MPTPAGEIPGRCERKSRQDLCSHPGRGFFFGESRSDGKESEARADGTRGTASVRSARRRYPLEARYVCESCFGPLEVSYDFGDLDAAEARRKIQAGSRGIWRYADFLPFAERPRDPLEPGLTPLIRADRLAERLGLASVWIKNDAANPTHSFKDRVVAVALAKAEELGFETVACASTGNLANAVAAHAAASGLDSYVFVPSDLEEQKLLATGVYGTRSSASMGTTTTSTACARELCETQPWAFVNVNLRPYYSRGIQDPRLRDGRAARLVAARPHRLPDRLRLAVHQARQRALRSGSISGWSRATLPTFNGAQPEGCTPVAERVRRGPGCLQAAAPRHDRQEPRDWRPCRRALRARSRAPHRRRRSTR